MGRRRLFLYTLLFSIMIMGSNSRKASAIDVIGDKLTLEGFLRYELAVHTGDQNPNNKAQQNNNWCNLSRTILQTELESKPFENLRDNFKLYARLKFINDSTAAFDSDLDSYDAFPENSKSEMRIGKDVNDYHFEATELYSDVSAGPIWMRLGRQQIVWGEMVAARIMDLINPLDQSWHLRYEPEEFDNIRVAQWSLRSIYTIEQNVIPWLSNLSIEGYLNPGDVVPDTFPSPGSPFFQGGLPPVFKVTQRDRRGDLEYGFRVGGSVGQFFGTLNYLHIYKSTPAYETSGFLALDAKYPLTEVYGATLNYAFGEPINTAVTVEATYTPNYVWNDAKSAMAPLPNILIKDQGVFNYGILFNRSTFVFPRPTSAMVVNFQFGQTIIEGDADDVIFAFQPVEKVKTVFALVLSQAFLKADVLKPGFQIVYDTSGAYFMKPSLKIQTGDHWFFDFWGNFLGGSEKRPTRFGSMDWNNEIVGRATFQF